MGVFLPKDWDKSTILNFFDILLLLSEPFASLAFIHSSHTGSAIFCHLPGRFAPLRLFAEA